MTDVPQLTKRQIIKLVFILPVITAGLFWIIQRWSLNGRTKDHYFPSDDSKAMQGLPSDALAVLHSLASLIVPSDEQGPGASDAQVVSELDRVLTEDRVRQVRYLAGLRAFDDYAQRECGARFAALPLNQQMQLVIGIEQVRDRIYAEAGSLSERLRRRLSYWYYTGWHEFLPLIEFWQLLRTDVLTVFYSNEVVWKWLGYSGPPFPLGYYPRVPGT